LAEILHRDVALSRTLRLAFWWPSPRGSLHGSQKCGFLKPGTHWQQSRRCHFGPVHNGNEVDHNKLSNSSCCRFVAKTDNKVDCISNSRLCRQCVPGFRSTVLLFGSRYCENASSELFRHGRTPVSLERPF